MKNSYGYNYPYWMKLIVVALAGGLVGHLSYVIFDGTWYVLAIATLPFATGFLLMRLDHHLERRAWQRRWEERMR